MYEYIITNTLLIGNLFNDDFQFIRDETNTHRKYMKTMCN